MSLCDICFFGENLDCSNELTCVKYDKFLSRVVNGEIRKNKDEKEKSDGEYSCHDGRIEPMIKLIKVTTQAGFRRYINADKINSITEIENGTSISTADHDGEFLVDEKIDDVLSKLGYKND